MAEDASLDDFVGTNDGSDDGEREPEAAESAEEEANTAAATGDDVATTNGDQQTAEPTTAATTYAWDGDGAECGACGETVERRWQQDGGLVCAACKEWERS